MSLQEFLTSEEFWKIVLTSSLITSIIGAISNWYFNIQKFKRESEAGFIGARASIYSRLWFWLHIWKCTDIDKPLSWAEFSDIDKILTEKQHLLSPDIQQKWFVLHEHVRDVARGRVDEETAANTVDELINSIRTEFNNDIRLRYSKYVGKTTQELAEIH